MNPYIVKDEECGLLVPTSEGINYLQRLVTDPVGPVYCFAKGADPLMAAAGMARLSRRGDDMRTIILDEFADAPPENMEALLDRVITAYGDDSVQQLMPIMLVVEDASNLLTKYLEWGRLGAYLEQSTRYIYFDQKTRNGEYRYHVPKHFSSILSQHYRDSMDQIFQLYSGMVRRVTDFVRKFHPFATSETDEKRIATDRIAWLGATRAEACDAVRPVLPVATTATVGIVASAQAVDNMIYQLSARMLPEAQETAVRILQEVRKVAAVFFKRTDRPDRGGGIIAHRRETSEAMRRFATDLHQGDLSHNPFCGTSNNPVTLLSYFPHDEADLIVDMLWSTSNLSDGEIRRQIAQWPAEKRQEVFLAYMGERFNRRHKPGRAVEFAHYKWEVEGDYGIFRDIQRHRMVDGMEWQPLTPYFGFEVPKLIIDAGEMENFRRCFAISEDLFGRISRAGFSEEAQYTTLLGHIMRWKFMENVREAFHIHEIRTQPAGHPGYRRLVGLMHDGLAKVHPNLAAAMKFVNRPDGNEDLELARLAAERATQARLALLG